jgi:hypothetical protein
MDNMYGKKALKQMCEQIWNCSRVKTVLENEADEADQANHLFVEVLKNIDDQLSQAIDSVGNSQNWEEGLIPFDATTKAAETHGAFMYNILTGPCRRLAQDRGKRFIALLGNHGLHELHSLHILSFICSQ